MTSLFHFSIMSSRFIRIVACIRTPFLRLSDIEGHMCRPHGVLSFSWLGCFYLYVFVSIAAVKTWLYKDVLEHLVLDFHGGILHAFRLDVPVSSGCFHVSRMVQSG